MSNFLRQRNISVEDGTKAMSEGNEISRPYEGTIGAQAEEPCECHLPQGERKYNQDPFDPKCVPCWSRECLEAMDDFIGFRRKQISEETEKQRRGLWKR